MVDQPAFNRPMMVRVHLGSRGFSASGNTVALQAIFGGSIPPTSTLENRLTAGQKFLKLLIWVRILVLQRRASASAEPSPISSDEWCDSTARYYCQKSSTVIYLYVLLIIYIIYGSSSYVHGRWCFAVGAVY